MNATPPPALSRMSELLMFRLLVPAKKPPTTKVVRGQLSKLTPVSEEQLESKRQELLDAGMIEPKALRLTESGRAHAMARLGLEEIPPKFTWAKVQELLFPLAAGVSPEDDKTRAGIKKAPYLQAYLLKRRYGVSADSPMTVSKVLEALACKELGFPHLATIADVKAAVLSRLIGSKTVLTIKDLEKQFPRIAFNTAKGTPGEIKAWFVKQWLAGEADAAPQQAGTTGIPPVPPVRQEPRRQEPPPPFELASFAATVRALAAAATTGRFGDNKVFISHVYRQFSEKFGEAMSLTDFKARLVEAARAGELQLSRADLVEAMDSASVKESETRHLNAEFHFVLIEERRSR